MKANKPVWLAAGAAVSALTFGLWYSQHDPATDEPPSLAASEINSGEPPPINAAPKPRATTMPPALTESEREAVFITDIRERFGPHLHRQHAQIRFLEQLISYLKAHYPDDWQQRVLALLQASFPDMSDELMVKYESLQSYNNWLLADRQLLQQMSPEDRRKALWDKRYAAFGMDADEIWAAEIRNQKIQDALHSVAINSDGSLVEKAASVVSAVRETYGASSDDFIQNRKTELVNKFLAIPSVQEELLELPAADRRESMREVRATMGMDTAALDRWEALDKARDETWSSGTIYMNERERIIETFEGSEESRELYALQKKMFGNDAEQIQREEASGFYRYDRLRRIGRE